MANSSPTQVIPEFIDEIVEFADGSKYELISPLTDYRKCHDGTPSESRIVFTCRQIAPSMKGEEFVIKIKVQVPDDSNNTNNNNATAPIPAGPSTTTKAELELLQRFKDVNSTHTPHLVAFKQTLQNGKGPLPRTGFVTYLVMTKLPGISLFNSQYWNKSSQERDVIVDEFMKALKWIYAFGVEPLDCGLRNVLWEPETKTCSLIDFELWREATGPIQDRTRELQRWALVRRPPPRDWWAEWNYQGR